MAQPALKGRHHLILSLSLALAAALGSGCTPRAGDSPPKLPPPQVRITPGSWRASGAEASPSPTLAGPPLAGAPESDIARLARQLFGDQLIQRIVIPSLRIDSPVVPVGWHVNPAAEDGEGVEWDSPNEAVGWMISSALPSQADGNTVLYGHNNMYTSIFRDLSRLAAGDLIYLYSSNNTWKYQVSDVEIIPISVRGGKPAEYLSYLEPTTTPRLTLISCWPPTSNTHRVVVTAGRIEGP